MPTGGQIPPTSREGDSLLWKKAQKNEKKNKISEVINRIIPHCNPETTFLVWSPWKLPSRVISRHHCTIVSRVPTIPRKNRSGLNVLNHFAKPTVNIKALKEAVSGHGLTSTRW